MNGKCPHCDKVATSLKYSVQEAQGGFNDPPLRVLTFRCPNLQCQKIISTQVDPFGINKDVVDALFRRLRAT